MNFLIYIITLIGLVTCQCLPLHVAQAAPSYIASSVRTVYSGTNVTTAQSLQVVSSLPYSVGSVGSFDNSGQEIQLIVSSSGGILTYIIIPPGGGVFPASIPSGSSISLLAISGTPSSGTVNDLNFFYN